MATFRCPNEKTTRRPAINSNRDSGIPLPPPVISGSTRLQLAVALGLTSVEAIAYREKKTGIKRQRTRRGDLLTSHEIEILIQACDTPETYESPEGAIYTLATTAAEMVNYQPDYVRQLIREGKIPGLNVSNRVFTQINKLRSYQEGFTSAVGSHN